MNASAQAEARAPVTDPSVARVRNRDSYAFFHNVAIAFGKGSLAGLLETVWEELDERHRWGSEMHAAWAQESMAQLLKDFEANAVAKAMVEIQETV